MALPNIFQGYQVLAPREGQNKSGLWLCGGHTRFWWLAQATELSAQDSTRATHAIAIATALATFDEGNDSCLYGEDAEDTERWMEALEDIDNCDKPLRAWDQRFVENVLGNPPHTFSEAQKKVIRRMADWYIGLKL